MARLPILCGALLVLIATAAPAGLSIPPSATPQPCASAPAPDSLMGSVGSKAPCVPAADASRPTVVQAANVITDGAGQWAVTWARPFTAASPVVNPLPVNAGALPILCNVAARSATGASGRCWQSTSTTLPGTLAGLAGTLVSPFGSPASGAAVMVIAREPTQ